MRWEKGKEEENIREWGAQEAGRPVRERKERNTLVEGAIKGLWRNRALWKFPGIHKYDPS